MRWHPVWWGSVALCLCGVMLCSVVYSASILHHGPVREYHFENGLTLLVKEDHRAPVATVQVWYRVGSSYEPEGLTGISHLLEHMMFRGTPAVGPGAFSRIVAQQGGRENAVTSYDFTYYYQQLPADRLVVALKLEADRLRHLSLKKADFKKELQVVMEERRLRIEDVPFSKAYERFMAMLHVASPYRQPVIGWMADLKNLSVKDLRAWYDTWYMPRNVVLVVVGDVKPHVVRGWVKHFFAGLPMSRPPVVKSKSDIPPLGERTLTLHIPAKLPLLMLGFPVPSFVTAKPVWQPYALQVLASVLSGGYSARLEKGMVRGKELASHIEVDYDPYRRMDSAFVFMGVPAVGHTLSELTHAFDAEVVRLKTSAISREELSAVKQRLIASERYRQDSPAYQASQLGEAEIIGLSWRDALLWSERINAVTAEQVKQVAQQYLRTMRRVKAELIPANMPTVTPKHSKQINQGTPSAHQSVTAKE